MTPERHQQIRDLFTAASERAHADRAAFLRERCEGDEDLHAEIVSLLEMESGATSDIEGAVQGAVREAASFAAVEIEAADSGLVGRMIGKYRIQRLIAVGGMGRVYEAEQAAPRRIVAVKLMRRGITTPRVLRRFEEESQALGRLRHPGIAQILEAGTFREDGERVPFYAMELIPGARTLTRYAQERSLDTRARLDLIARVCDAVHHGHQKGVIHRDLKPDNILVDSDGQPKVIDFGVARVTDSDIAITTLQTQVGQLLGTLQYMSPEQCGDHPHDVDVRTDVYSLGVILYELLCGVPPYELSRLAIPAATRVIQQQVPPRPSSIRKVLRGAVETIVLKAMDKDRERRYQSAAELADDLRRFLAGKRIHAKPPGVLAVVGAWVANHPVGATGAACALIVLCSISLTLLSVHLLARRPDRVTIDAAARRATLVSVVNKPLYSWDSGSDGGVSHALWVERPKELGGGNLALIGFGRIAGKSGHAGELCAFEVDGARRLLWSTDRFPLEFPDGEKGHPDSSMALLHALVADVIPDSPGPEVVVVHQLYMFAATAIRVFDLAGNLRYQVWHDGAVRPPVWLEASGTLVFAGVNSEHVWQERGLDLNESWYPPIVFGLKIQDGHINTKRWIVRDGNAIDPTLAWYRWLGPTDALAAAGFIDPFLASTTGSLDPRDHVQVWFPIQDMQSKKQIAALVLTIGSGGAEVARFTDDSYKMERRRGRLQPDERLRLLNYDELPAVLPTGGDQSGR